MDNGWKVKLTLEVKGPKEGPVVAEIEYKDTIKAVAIEIQNRLATLVTELNQQG